METQQNTSITVFSDGGARPNPGPIGSGYYGEDSLGMSHVWWKSVPGSNTNNDAEVLAAITTFQHAIAKNWKQVILRPDSQYVLTLIENRKRYLENGFKNSKGLDLPNIEQAKLLVTTVEHFLKQGGQYTTQWVKAHSGVRGNELADQMATRGVIAAQKGVEVEEQFSIETKKFGKYKSATYDRLLSNDKLYFITHTQQIGGYHVYHTGHHGKDDQDAAKKGKVNTSFGKMLPESLSCLVLMKEPQVEIDYVIDEQIKLFPDLAGVPFIGNLGAIFAPATWNEIKEYKGLYLYRRRSVCDYLRDSADRLLTRAHKPVKLGILAMERRLGRVEDVVDYLGGNTDFFESTDITNHIFTLVTKTKGKKEVAELDLNAELKLKGVAKIPVTKVVDGETYKATVRLNIGHDLYDVNAHQAFRKQNPKVELLTWADGFGMRYGVLYRTDTGVSFREPIVSNLLIFSSDNKDKKR